MSLKRLILRSGVCTLMPLWLALTWLQRETPGLAQVVESTPPGGALASSAAAIDGGESAVDPAELTRFGIARLEDALHGDTDAGPVGLLDDRYVRILSPEEARQAPEEDGAGTRGDSACNNIAYNNQATTFVPITPINFANGLVDDCRLAPTVVDTFICSATVRTKGVAVSGAATYDLLIEVWSDCPDALGAVMIAGGTHVGLPNDRLLRDRTIDVSPDYHDADGVIWVKMRSDSPDAYVVLGGTTLQAGDIGSTLSSFAIPNGQTGCDLYQFTNTSIYGGMSITLRGTQGPMGACCDTTTGTCAPSLGGDCGSYTQRWTPGDCGSAPPCMACGVAACLLGGPGNLENEPDCTTNYVDAANRGCATQFPFQTATTWTPLSAPQSGCGRSGAYSFLNGSLVESRVDSDQYLLVLTQDARVTWRVRGVFPVQAAVTFTLRQTNSAGPLSCGLNVTTAAGDTPVVTAAACHDAIATACLPGRPSGFRYLLLAQPQNNIGIPCGSNYEWDVSTQPCTLPTSGACCTPTGCIESSPLGCLIGFNQYHGDGSDCGSLPVPCAPGPPNDTCTASKIIYSNTVDVVIPFDTTFANTETVSYTQSTPVFKDVWFEYLIPSIGSATRGRLALSTIGTCFNSKVAVFEVRNHISAVNAMLPLTQTQRCANLGGNGLQARGTGVPYLNTYGTPSVPLAGFCYVDVAQGTGPSTPFGIVTGKAYKIRVGGINDSEFGQGFLRVSFVPEDSGSPEFLPWDLNAGRCCLPGGGCVVTPYPTGWTGPPAVPPDTTPDNCAELGGFLTNTTDFQQGNSDPGNPATFEFRNVGCASIPCPAEGEACWNALDFNALVGGGFGTLTRATMSALYVKYSVPLTAVVGSGIAFDTCGSLDHGTVPLDTAIAVYNSFNAISGECDFYYQAPGPLARNDECGPDDVSAAAAQGRAACYGGVSSASCLCFRVVDGLPGPGELQRGQTYWIAVGAHNDVPVSFDFVLGRPYIDPVRNECRPEGPVTFALRVTSHDSCYSCSRPACVGTLENEPDCATNYVDQTNAGCSTLSLGNQLYRPLAPGQTYCGQSATFRTIPPCLSQSDCTPGSTCTPPYGGFCEDDSDNTRDFDWYRVVVTAARRLTWQVGADFPAAIQFIAAPNATSTLLGDPSDTDSCVGTVVLASRTNLDQCDTSIAEADVCPGVYYLSVTVASEQGTPCTAPRAYTATLLADDPSIVPSACCKGDLNNDGRIDSTDIQRWIDEVRSPVTSVENAAGCYAPIACRADFTNDFLVTIDDLSGFVTALIGKPACPPTVCEDAAACHLPGPIDGGAISDLSGALGGDYRVADDFRVTSAGSGQQITSLCWWGWYFDYSRLIACPMPGADDFRISFYADAGGVPGAKLAPTFSGLAVTRTDTGVDLDYLGRQVRRYKYEATLPVPVGVADGGCYWLEIVNQTSGDCLWLWETSSTGNAVTVQRNGGPAGKVNWGLPDRVHGADQTWCLSGVRVSESDCGPPLGRCCTWPPGTCATGLEADCPRESGGRWTPFADCASPCPPIPLNDSCPDALLITANALYTGSTFYATRDIDSVPMTCELSCGQNCNTANDVWFKWVNNDPAFGGPIANPVFSMCSGFPPFLFDSTMVIYTGCPTAGGVPTLPGCSDDSCSSGSGVSRVVLFNEPVGVPPFCTPGVNCYRTYWIRISGWSGTNGKFMLTVYRQ